jgi:outer membrane biosynthesis protein TonB
MRNYWKTALFVSLVIHLIIFVFLGYFTANDRVDSEEQENSIEVVGSGSDVTSYVSQVKKILTKTKPPPYRPQRMQKNFKPESVDDFIGNSMQSQQFAAELKLLNQTPKMERLKENPAYLDYYQSIREKIKQYIYQNYNLSDSGEVTLSFTILNSGELAAVSSKKGAQDLKLLNTVIKSIESAAPFKSFPKELPYSRLRFNLAIYFKSN